jgi:hypothetical protein
MMDKELKTKWILALQSGEYRKGKSELHNFKKDTYCCLGVLQMVTDGKTTPVFDDFGDIYEEIPPLSYLDKVGLNSDLAIELAEVNDDTRTFTEVIDIIKEKV